MPTKANWNKPLPPQPCCTSLMFQPDSVLAPAATVRMKSGSLASSPGALRWIRSFSQPGTPEVGAPDGRTPPGAPCPATAEISGAVGVGAWRVEANCCTLAPAACAAPRAEPRPAPGSKLLANCCTLPPAAATCPNT